MPVQLKVQLVSVAEDGSERAEDLLVLTKQHERLEQLGLTLAEGKQLLREVAPRVAVFSVHRSPGTRRCVGWS